MRSYFSGIGLGELLEVAVTLMDMQEGVQVLGRMRGKEVEFQVLGDAHMEKPRREVAFDGR